MSIKRKNILKNLSIVSLSMPIALTSFVSCSNEHMYDELAQHIKADAIEEFVGSEILKTGNEIPGITSIFRPTFHTKQICEYLVGRINDILPSTLVHFDHYNSGEDDSGCNMYFDIPANDENMSDFILQCHTDMVWVANKEYLLDHPTPQITTSDDGRPIIKSENQQSSLGADNGIGIATALAIAKNRASFKHGKIRVLLTTDEENGPSGAAFVPSGDPGIIGGENWFFNSEKQEYFPYLLNLDLERSLKLAMSCGGTEEARWKKEFDLVELDKARFTKPYCLHISGLHGQHSALGVIPGYQNAFNILFHFLSDINGLTSVGRTVQIYQCLSSSGIDIKTTVIPDEAQIIFYFEKGDDTDTEIDKLIYDYESYYEDVEPDMDIKCYPYEESMPKTVYVLSGGHTAAQFEKGDSEKLMNLIANLPSGALEEGDYRTSSNIGGVRFNDDSGSGNDIEKLKYNEVLVQVMGRSSLPEKLGNNPEWFKKPSECGGFWKKFHDASAQIFPEEEQLVEQGKDRWLDKGWTPLWEHKEGNQLSEVLIQGAKAQKYEIEPYDEVGWLEVAYFDLHTQDKLHMGAIGYELENVHNVKETLYLDSMEPTIKLVLYSLQHAPELHIPYRDNLTRKEGRYE